jgi:hypothetical protein
LTRIRLLDSISFGLTSHRCDDGVTARIVRLSNDNSPYK